MMHANFEGVIARFDPPAYRPQHHQKN